MKKRGNKRRLNKNPSALFSFALVILSGIIFPIFSTKLFGETFSNTKTAIFNIILDLFSGKMGISKGYELAILGMVFVYVLIALFYLLNGLGVIYNRYSRHASILSIFYLFLGLISVLLINRTGGFSLFGFEIASITLGLGTYFITIVGVAYLFFHRWINSVVRL